MASYLHLCVAVILSLMFTATIASAQAVTAEAGEDQTVAEGVIVTLDARASQGENLRYTWFGETTVRLNANNIAMPTFTAPSQLTADVDLVFDLTVFSLMGTGSSTDRVTITVLAPLAPDITASTRTLIVPAGRAITPVTIDSSAGGRATVFTHLFFVGNFACI